MASVHVYNEIKDRLQAELPYAVIDFDSIEPSLQNRTDPFLVLEEIEAEEIQAAMGDPISVCMMESGSIVVHGFVPAPESSDRARKLADDIRRVLRHARWSSIRIRQVAPADMEILNEGLWSSSGTYLRYDYDFYIQNT